MFVHIVENELKNSSTSIDINIELYISHAFDVIIDNNNNMTETITQLLQTSEHLLALVPELSELQGLSETNPWHDHDDFFVHTMAVCHALEKALDLDFLPAERRAAVNTYLDQPVGNLLRREVLSWAGLLHDIAKKETRKEYPDGAILCPNHDIVGAEKTERIVQRFDDLTDADRSRIVRIVRAHLVPHSMIDSEKLPGQEQADIESTREEYEDIWIEMLLLGMADTQGCQLDRLNPADFDHRIRVYHRLLEEK